MGLSVKLMPVTLVSHLNPDRFQVAPVLMKLPANISAEADVPSMWAPTTHAEELECYRILTWAGPALAILVIWTLYK